MHMAGFYLCGILIPLCPLMEYFAFLSVFFLPKQYIFVEEVS